ncbi:hypothetical protein D9M70_637910 [compost metagenome]
MLGQLAVLLLVGVDEFLLRGQRVFGHQELGMDHVVGGVAHGLDELVARGAVHGNDRCVDADLPDVAERRGRGGYDDDRVGV